MKKLIALLLCAAMLCTVSAALAEAPIPIPALPWPIIMARLP